MAEVSTPQITIQSTPESLSLLGKSTPADGAVMTKEKSRRASNSPEARPTPNSKGFSGIIRTLSSGPGALSSEKEGRRESSSGIDPISKQIFERARAEQSNSSKILQINTTAEVPTDDFAESPTTPSRTSTEPGITRNDSVLSMGKESRKNRSSFFSRFVAKKKDSIETLGDEEDSTDRRAEGTNAETFSQPIGYIPKFLEPPKYIKVRAKGKKDKDFDRVFLAQELRGRTSLEVAQAGGRKINPSEKAKRGAAVWSIEFSKDGRYLAAGGHDHIVRVWGVLTTDEDRRAHEKQEEAGKSDTQTRLSAPVFKAKPVQEYEGHTATVLDLSWSKNNFLLSSSMDKTVRLWHTSRSECLCAFKHSDFVTSIQFHPRDDRFFLAGSLDSKLRLWSIPDKSVAYWTRCTELVTAVSFTPDGKTAIAGCLSGVCIFYETEGLRQQTQMHVRSTHGKNAKGSKITGIQSINYPPSDPNGDVKLLITSNDSRVRIYNFRDKSLELKLKGAENESSQIRASFSDDAKYIITGSEDKKAYIWSTGPTGRDKDKRPMETFEAHASIVTAAIMAPCRTRQLLQASGDPLFDICNPPPVQLVSRAESHSSYPATENEQAVDSAPATPATFGPNKENNRKPEESPAWITRSAHPNGNIIVTADFEGHIKVFRQDCAYAKRLRNNDNWDAGSTFSKNVLRRSPSIATRTSKHSTRDSLTYPSDRILSWRQSIDRSSIHNSPSLTGVNDVFSPTPTRKNFSRSISPQKSHKSSVRHGTNGNHARPIPNSSTSSVPGTEKSATANNSLGTNASSEQTSTPSSAPRQHGYRQTALLSAPEVNPLLITPDGSSDAFFSKEPYESQASNLQRFRTIDIEGNSAEQSRRASIESPRRNDDKTGHFLRPHMDSTSKLSSAGSGSSQMGPLSSGGVSESDDDEGERCSRCGSENFRAKKKGSARVLECVICGKVVA